MRSWHVQMRFDVSDRNFDAVHDNVRRGLEKVAPNMAVELRRGRLRKAEGGERRWFTLIMTVDTVDSATPPVAERRALYWLQRAVPTFQSRPPFIQAKELT